MKLLCAMLLLIVAATSASAESAPPSGSKNTISIGVIAPLTGSTAYLGADAQLVLPALAELVNKQGARYEYRFIIEDGRCGAGNSAVSAAQKLLSVDKVRYLVVGCSGEVMQIAPLVEKSKIVTVVFAGSHPEIKGLGEYIFRLYPNMDIEMKRFSERIAGDGVTRLAVLTEENAFTFGIRDVLKRELVEKVAFADDFPIDDSDLRSLLIKAKTVNPDAYYLNVASPTGYLSLFKRIRELGLVQPLYGYYQPANPEVLAALGKLQDGVVFLDMPRGNDGAQNFAEAREALEKQQPGWVPTLEFLLRTSFDSGSALIRAIEAAGDNQEAVQKALLLSDFQGASGRVHFDPNGDIEGLHFEVHKIVAGKPVPVD